MNHEKMRGTSYGKEVREREEGSFRDKLLSALEKEAPDFIPMYIKQREIADEAHSGTVPEYRHGPTSATSP